MLRAGTWTPYAFGTVGDDHTRPIVQLDADNRQIYVFATSRCCTGGSILHKRTSLDAIAFPPGKGTPFIKSATDFHINDASGTKQRLGRLTGLTVLAGDDTTDFYLHNHQTL